MYAKNLNAAAKATFIQENLERLKRDLAAAQQRYKFYADRNSQPMHFDVGQQVLLSSKNIRLKTPPGQCQADGQVHWTFCGGQDWTSIMYTDHSVCFN